MSDATGDSSPKDLTGACHCGRAAWTLTGDPGSITVCNCTLCRKNGALWAYDYDGERIHVQGDTASYVRADVAEPSLETMFCPTCGCVVAWRGLSLEADGRRRCAVNVRLAPPDEVAGLVIDRFEGLVSFEDLPRDGRCVSDYLF